MSLLERYPLQSDDLENKYQYMLSEIYKSYPLRLRLAKDLSLIDPIILSEIMQ